MKTLWITFIVSIKNWKSVIWLTDGSSIGKSEKFTSLLGDLIFLNL